MTLEIQKKIEDVIRPRAGINTSRIAMDMMLVHRGVENETSRILQMLYSQEQMDHQSKASMSKLSEADAGEDVRLRLPAGTTGGAQLLPNSTPPRAPQMTLHPQEWHPQQQLPLQ